MKKILSSDDFSKVLYRLAKQILEKNPKVAELVLIGVQTRGVYLARRIQATIKEIEGVSLPVGTLDITLYRDDLTTIGPSPLVKETKINFDLENKEVVLVDDVLYTGRTARAALNEIMDFGRPKRINFLVLIDRGHRELPIRADFVGKNVPTAKDELVEIKFKESDGKDEAVIIGKNEVD